MFCILLFLEKFPRVNVTQRRLKEIIEKNKLKQSLLNKKNNAIKPNKKKDIEIKNDNKHIRSKLTERKINNNVITNQKNITQKMNPRKRNIKVTEKNYMYKILTKKPIEIINETNKKLIENNNQSKIQNNESQINIDSNLIKKYVKKGSFSISPKSFKNIESSFEIYPKDIDDNKLSPIKPVTQFNILDEINIKESKIIPINDNVETTIISESKSNYLNRTINPSTLKVSKKKPIQLLTINNNEDYLNIDIDNNEIFNINNKALAINSEIDDPFLTISPTFNGIDINDMDEVCKDFDYILCKEQKELSITEEDDEILI